MMAVARLATEPGNFFTNPNRKKVDIYLEKAVGIGEHSDVLEAIEKELEVVAKYDDQLNVLRKYFI